MFSRVLIANRGEIALRIIRTCKRLGIETVAIHSEADRGAVYLKLADGTCCVGPAPSAESYLDKNAIIAAAEVYDVEAIHPGYGFLAEDAHFADLCRDCQISFIGPPVEAMELLGNKVRAVELAKEIGIRTVPGSDGPLESQEHALEVAHKISYPVILKASAGGGGRGMRVARNDVALLSSYNAARSEAQIAFGDPTLYMEKYIESPRHVEIQILGDCEGNVIHLGERDCSVQRRHQKMIEESPSPGVDKKLRTELGRAAVKLMRAAKYTNAGTVEFLVDGPRSYYFMEANARIQVEHPVTEMVTRMDLVEQQFRIAAGEPLGFKQKNIRLNGHAIECRINCEDPEAGFSPRPGTISTFFAPTVNGIRVDSHVHSGYTVPSAYDSMLAKVIVHGKDRNEAISKMRLALEEFVIEGVPTNIDFLREVLAHHRFARGMVDTHFVEDAFFG